ncbi:MAG: DNA repair protein RadC [Deltaproteobacteria bacterium]|nr:DNA repair protein RadC [Deltaproteobacteria bacterium]
MSSSRHKGEGHRERLRDKFLQNGLTGFADYEVIELLLTLGTPRKDCKQSAKQALAKFKTLPGVIEAADSELFEINGIGKKNIFGIKLIKAAANRYLKERLKGKNAIKSAEDLFDYLYFNLRHKDKEYCLAIYLDIKNNILNTETISEGSIGINHVYPREIVKAAIKNKAASVILVHNHPSGEPEPSQSDINITKKIVSALKTVDIKLLDHIIIGTGKYYSFADKGEMKIIEEGLKKDG